MSLFAYDLDVDWSLGRMVERAPRGAGLEPMAASDPAPPGVDPFPDGTGEMQAERPVRRANVMDWRPAGRG